MKEYSDAVSEIIGAILLISVVTVAIAIIAVALFSNPVPTEVPQANIVAVRNNSTQVVTMVHVGGDVLNLEELKVRLDGGPALSMFSGIFTKIPPGTLWSPGESIQINQQPGPTKIDLIYTGGGGEVLIDTIEVQAVSPGSGPDIPAPPGPCDGIEDLYLNCFTSKAKSNSVYLSRSKPGAASYISGDLYYTIAETDQSYLVVNSQKVKLHIGDRVQYHFNPSTPNIRIFMIGNFGWTASITGTSGHTFSLFLTYANGTRVSWEKSGTSLDESWIGNYTDMTSTLTLFSAGQTQSYTRLVVNGTMRCDSNDNTGFRIDNAQPSTPTLWVVVIPKSTEDNFLYIGSGTGLTPTCCPKPGCCSPTGCTV